MLVDDASFTSTWITTTLVPLLRDPGRIAAMSTAIASVGSRDGADRMTDLVLAAGTHVTPVKSNK